MEKAGRQVAGGCRPYRSRCCRQEELAAHSQKQRSSSLRFYAGVIIRPKVIIQRQRDNGPRALLSSISWIIYSSAATQLVRNPSDPKMAWRVLTKHQLEETKKQFAASGYVMQWYAMAMEVILTTLGPEWWKKNCLSTSPKADEFLAITDDSEESGYSHQDRIVKLGHMLYELKDQKGYEAFITSLRTRDLAPTFFELWVANALNQNGFTVEFVEAKGQK